MYMLRAYQSPYSTADCGPQCAQIPNFASRYQSGICHSRSDSRVPLKGPGAMARSGLAETSWIAARPWSMRPPSWRREIAAWDLRDNRSAGAPEIKERALLLVILTFLLPPRHFFRLKQLEVSARGDSGRSAPTARSESPDQTMVVEKSPCCKVGGSGADPGCRNSTPVMDL